MLLFFSLIEQLFLLSFRNSWFLRVTNTSQKKDVFLQGLLFRFHQIWSHLLKKSLMGNFVFCTMQLNVVSIELNILIDKI